MTARKDIDWTAVEQEAAQLLSRYIQFDTSNPPGNERLAIEFLADVLRERDFEPQIILSTPERANLVVRLRSQCESPDPPCLLYTHADVVPADPEGWSHPPFSGHIRDGLVWGRGALDNKGLGVIFLQAITLLKQVAPRLNRDIILLVAADEEVAGKYGVAWLLDHIPELIKAEYVWDEGGMGLRQADYDRYYIAITEKISLTVKLIAHGTPGHASIPQVDNAQDRLIRALSRLKRWNHTNRLTPVVAEMLQILAPYQYFPLSFLFANPKNPLLWPLLHRQLAKDMIFSSLICDTTNLTILSGGQTSNVVPARAEATLDVRLLPDQDPTRFLVALRSIINDSKISIETEELPLPQTPMTTDTLFYRTLTQTLQLMDPSGQITPYLTPGATDSRFFRAAGMKAYGFMPMRLTGRDLSRVHGIDEQVSTANLRWGIQVVFETLKRL